MSFANLHLHAEPRPRLAITPPAKNSYQIRRDLPITVPSGSVRAWLPVGCSCESDIPILPSVSNPSIEATAGSSSRAEHSASAYFSSRVDLISAAFPPRSGDHAKSIHARG